MNHAFVLLTPLLLLPIIALLGFVGCNLVFPLQAPVATPVQHVQTVVKSATAGASSIAADPLTLAGGELLIVTVQWRSPTVQQPPPALSGAVFSPIPGAGPFDWNGMNIQSFVATNPANSTSVAVQAQLAGGSIVPWNLCVTAYKGYDPDSPVYSPISSGPIFVGTDIKSPAINVGEGDKVYAVAFAADNDGTFPGSNSLTPGANFTAEFTVVANPMVEDGGSGNPVVAEAINTASGPNPRGFIFAMGIKAQSA